MIILIYIWSYILIEQARSQRFYIAYNEPNGGKRPTHHRFNHGARHGAGGPNPVVPEPDPFMAHAEKVLGISSLCFSM